MNPNTHNANGEEYPDVKERREFDEAREGLRAFASGESALSIEHAAILNSTLTLLDHTMDVHTVSKGYHFVVSITGEVWALTAGDHNYEPTKFELDMIGWEQSV